MPGNAVAFYVLYLPTRGQKAPHLVLTFDMHSNTLLRYVNYCRYRVAAVQDTHRAFQSAKQRSTEMAESSATTPQSSVAGDPTGGAVALLTVVTLLLGLQFIGAIPAASISLFVPILLVAGVAQLLLGLLAVRKGENIIGLFFCTFGPFLISFGLLIVGLQHHWWAIKPTDIPHAEAAFLIGWTIVLTLWFFLSLALPLIFTALLAFVDTALWLLVVGIWNTSTSPEKLAGWMLLATGVGGLYFISALWLEWAGVAALPHGRPLIRRRQSTIATATPAAATI
jgi:uncharacterized protein